MTKRCFECDGSGLKCDVCGESEAACHCDPDEDPICSDCPCCDGTGEVEVPAAPVDETPCTCGSGAHPRVCKRHPSAFAEHIEALNEENAADLARAPVDETESGEACERCKGRGTVATPFVMGPDVTCNVCRGTGRKEGK